jgi:hypothetical protein
MRSLISTSSAAAISFSTRLACRDRSVRQGTGGRDDLEKLLLGCKRFEPAAPLDHERSHSRHGFLFKRSVEENVGIENDPHPALGATSFCARLMSRSIPSSVNAAAMTRARDARRPRISSSGSIVIITRSFGSSPRRNLAHGGFDHFASGRHWLNSCYRNLGGLRPFVKFGACPQGRARQTRRHRGAAQSCAGGRSRQDEVNAYALRFAVERVLTPAPCF